jgi:hypothetical protein
LEVEIAHEVATGEHCLGDREQHLASRQAALSRLHRPDV